MKTVKLTAEEMRWLHELLWCNPCSSGCILDKFHSYDCYDMRKDGTYKCPMNRARESIRDKVFGNPDLEVD